MSATDLLSRLKSQYCCRKFCHRSAIQGGTKLREGEQVTYTLEWDERRGKHRAAQVNGAAVVQEDSGGGGGGGGYGRRGGGGYGGGIGNGASGGLKRCFTHSI